MFPRTIKRYSSSSSASASARAGIKNIVLGSEQAQSGNGITPEELSYQTKTFEDGEASPIGTPLSSRRSSLSSAALASRRNSTRSSLLPNGMTPFTPAAAENAASATSPSSSTRAFSSSASVNSEEHGSYQFSPKEMAAVKKRVEEEFMLKSVTRAPLRTVRPSAKVPYEDVSADGRARHPSGFVVPAPGDAPTVLQAETRVRPAHLAARGIPESVLTFADLKEMATADQTTRSEKVPQEVRVLDGTVEHPSGFVPPSPQQPLMSGVKELYKPAVNLGPTVGTARN